MFSGAVLLLWSRTMWRKSYGSFLRCFNTCFCYLPASFPNTQHFFYGRAYFSDVCVHMCVSISMESYVLLEARCTNLCTGRVRPACPYGVQWEPGRWQGEDAGSWLALPPMGVGELIERGVVARVRCHRRWGVGGWSGPYLAGWLLQCTS